MELELFILAGIVFLWLVSAWEALSSMSGGRIRRIENKNKDLARRVESWLDHKKEYSIVFKILLLLLTAYMAFSLYRYLKSYEAVSDYAGITTVAAVFLLVVLADILGRFLLLRFDILILKITIPFVRGLRYSVLAPVLYVINIIDSEIERLQHEGEDDKTTAEDEIMSWVERENENGKENDLEEDEKRMIRGIFDLDDTPVREIMTPRVDMTSLPAKSTIIEAKREIVESGHSRIPIYGENVDEIKGIIFAKDFLDEKISENTKLEDIAHKPVFIPESKAVGDLLDEFKKNSNHFAVIIDEYGGTSGIVTLEDIIEEIVGEILDEYDTEEDVDPEPVKMPDGTFILDARTLIHDVNELLDSDIPEDEDADTIGGYVCGEIGRIPESGEELELEDGIHVTILKADRRKILTMKLKLVEEENGKSRR